MCVLQVLFRFGVAGRLALTRGQGSPLSGQPSSLAQPVGWECAYRYGHLGEQTELVSSAHPARPASGSWWIVPAVGASPPDAFTASDRHRSATVEATEAQVSVTMGGWQHPVTASPIRPR